MSGVGRALAALLVAAAPVVPPAPGSTALGSTTSDTTAPGSTTPGSTTPESVPPPPAPDAAALARLPVAPSAVPGEHPLGPCPAGVAPTALDAFELPAGDDVGALPGGGAGQLVAVVDTGVAPHPRLAGRLVDGGDFVAGRSGLADCDGHGTAVAGLLAAAPSPADLVEGAVPNARVLAVRQTSAWFATPSGPGVGDIATLARAVRWAAATPGVGVMTLALAACATSAEVRAPAAQEALGALRAAIRDATDRGVVVVAAAGNVGGPGGCGAQPPRGIASVPVPGWFDDDVLTVGAVDDSGPGEVRPDPTSLPGPWVDVAAPGRAAASLDARGPGLTTALTVPGSSPSPLAGTSVAVPRVAAVAAEIRRRAPTLPARAVAARIVRTASPLPGRPDPAVAGARDAAVGAGVLDAAAALADAPARTAPTPVSGPGAAGAAAGAVGVVGAAGVGVLVVLRRRRRRGAR